MSRDLSDGAYRAPDGKCSQEGCTRTFRNHMHGMIDAHNKGWFFSKEKGEIWCPDHTPEWVAAWRARIKRAASTSKEREA